MSAQTKLSRRVLGKTGFHVSSMGIGGSPLGQMFNKHHILEYEEAFKMVKYGLDQGINIIDTSPFYGLGKSEIELGKILRTLHDERLHKRESYHLCTKIGRYGFEETDYSIKRTQQSIEESLNRLQTNYIDILHIHDFDLTTNGLQQIWEETLPYLYELKTKPNSVIKRIGLSGIQLIVMDYVAQKFGYDKIDTFLTVNHYNILNVQLLNFIQRLNKYNIGVIQGGATYLGLLTTNGPQSWFPQQEQFLYLGRKAVSEIQKESNKYYGTKYDEDAISRLAFLFSHCNMDIATTLVGANTLREMHRNIDYILDENYDNINDKMNENDQAMIKYLQTQLFADIMNVNLIPKVAQANVMEAVLANEWI